MPPKHILNAPTKLMKSEEGTGQDKCNFQLPRQFIGTKLFRMQMRTDVYYEPFERGFEREIQKQLDYWAKLRKKEQLNGLLYVCKEV